MVEMEACGQFMNTNNIAPMMTCSVCFNVNYFLENVFSFSEVCLQIKYSQTCKILSVYCKIFYKKL